MSTIRFYQISCTIFIFFLIAGCAKIETAFNVFTFQTADNTGVTKGQKFLVYPLGGDGFFDKSNLNPLLQKYDDVSFQSLVKKCTISESRRKLSERAFGPFTSLSTVITNLGGLIYNKLINEIDEKAKQLAKRSVDRKSIIVSWYPRRGMGHWRNLRCLLIARLTDRDGDKVEDEVGLLAIVARQNLGPSSSMLRPVYFRLNNAIAITGASDKPKFTVGMAFTINSVVNGKIVSNGEIKLASDISAIIGERSRVCVDNEPQNRPLQFCPMSTEMFIDPSPNATAFQLKVGIGEVGSAANIAEGVTESKKVLNSLVKPIFDEFFKKLAEAAKSK